jgi:hypothetical protein
MFILSNQLENVSPAKGSGLSDKQNQDGSSDDMPSIQRANTAAVGAREIICQQEEFAVLRWLCTKDPRCSSYLMRCGYSLLANLF